ncbi:MAG: 5'/3'-nucleotidase SurE [Haloarculaceae archaeon]
MAGPSILVTNDDGVDSEGLRAVCDALRDVGEVTVVAPETDQSAIGRALSHEVTVNDHDLGYTIEGTPADCVVAGLEALVPDADLVVAGCNRGANLGSYVLGRSGTVSAAVEATFFDVPAIAVSMYVPASEDADRAEEEREITRDSYAEAARATRFLAERAPEAGVFEQADYLNVNAPIADLGPCDLAVTRPSEAYLMGARREGADIQLYDGIWERMAAGDLDDPDGTDRRAVVEGDVSVSPLTAPHTTEHHDALDGLVADYR